MAAPGAAVLGLCEERTEGHGQLATEQSQCVQGRWERGGRCSGRAVSLPEGPSTCKFVLAQPGVLVLEQACCVSGRAVQVESGMRPQGSGPLRPKALPWPSWGVHVRREDRRAVGVGRGPLVSMEGGGQGPGRW